MAVRNLAALEHGKVEQSSHSLMAETSSRMEALSSKALAAARNVSLSERCPQFSDSAAGQHSKHMRRDCALLQSRRD